MSDWQPIETGRRAGSWLTPGLRRWLERVESADEPAGRGNSGSGDVAVSIAPRDLRQLAKSDWTGPFAGQKLKNVRRALLAAAGEIERLRRAAALSDLAEMDGELLP